MFRVGRAPGLLEVAVWQYGQVRQLGRVPARRRGLERFADDLVASDRVALEATSNALAVTRIIASRVAQVTTLNTRRLGAISGAKTKTDRRDAATLARLLAAGMGDNAWQRDETARRLRRLVSRCAQLVRQRTRCKNEVLAALYRNLLPRRPSPSELSKLYVDAVLSQRMSQRIVVTVENDHLESLARPSSSLAGVVELIWNALDAEAESVVVALTQDELHGVSRVSVVDDGHGMRRSDALEEFAHLGGSWKRHTQYSKNRGRLLHGKQGQGRWRAFSIGSLVRWITVADSDGGREQTTITGRRGSLTQFDVSEAQATSDPVGTTVHIENVDDESASALLADDAADKLTAMLAPYLERYPTVTITFRDQRLDPAVLQAHRAEYEVDLDGSAYGPLSMIVIEWNRSFPRELLLSDENGIALYSEHPGIQAPAFDFTAYLRWRGFREHEPELATAPMHPILGPAIDAARDQLREHFRSRLSDLHATVIEDWKRENVYPYEGDVPTGIAKVERDLFDVVAATAAKAVNSTSDRVGKRFSLRLLREAVEQSPSALRRVLQEVLELPDEKLAELDQLLERTSLTSIVALGKVVADRLDFLAGLREMVFDPDTRKVVLERSQLHRILANEVWLFGDEYTLAVDDEGLAAALQVHVKLLGRDLVAEDLEPATLEDGSRGIVDLLLAATIPLPTQQHDHLVVELKRPSQRLGHDELTQISRYADAVARDARFDKVNVRWNFWLIGTEMDQFVQGQANQPHLPPGIVSRPMDGRVTIWAKTWSQIIDDAEQRLKFVRERLEYRSTRDGGLDYLRRQHDKYLPEALRSAVAE